MKTNEAVMSTLNNLIETCKDGENGFHTAADSVTNSQLRTLFNTYARQRAQFAAELQAEVRRLGGDPERTGSSQLIPGSGAVTPIAGTLVARAYSRSEEHEADRHGVEILRRANVPKPKEAMINTLTWLMQASGPSEGGFFSTHPGTVERIEAIQKMR